MSQREELPHPPDCFQTKEDAIRWVLDTNHCLHKEARTRKSDTTRIHFQCTQAGCEFSCNINKHRDGLFRVAKWSWHTCGIIKNPTVKRTWVKQMAKKALEDDEEVKPMAIQNTLREDLGVKVKDPAVRKAVAEARKDKDEKDASFDKLPGLFQVLKEQNPGTVAEIETEEGRLKMAFLCPGPCARAWTHCTKLIALDGTFGTSMYNGVVLIASALDGAGQIFPIAFAFAPSESTESWRFFVQHLADALNIRETPLTVISDRCKGIDAAVAEVLPRAAHSYCAFHMKQNVVKNQGLAAAKFVYRIADACTEHEYVEAMTALGNISPDARDYLADIGREQWVRAFFPLPRYGHLTSNIAESTNAALKKFKKYPPLKFFVKAIRKINTTFAERREHYANGNPMDIVDNIMQEIATNIEAGRRMVARNVFGNVFDVQTELGSNSVRIVDLVARTCSCKMFQDLGYPCAHACAAALETQIDIMTLCIDERRIGALRAVYEMGIIPVDVESVQSMVLLPPLVHRLPGRPKSKRIRSKAEDRYKRANFCSQCGKRGHNIRTCPDKEN